MSQQRVVTNSTGTVSTVKDDRDFGFLIFATASGRQLRIYFNFADTDGTVFHRGDSVSFDIGVDGQGRPRAFNVKLISSDVCASNVVNPTEARRGDN